MTSSVGGEGTPALAISEVESTVSSRPKRGASTKLRALRWAPVAFLLLAVGGLTARRILAKPQAPRAPGEVRLAPQATGAASSQPFSQAITALSAINEGFSQGHGGPRRTGQASGTVSLPLRILWQKQVEGAVVAEPVASVDGATVYIATVGGHLEALATADGTRKFFYDFGARSYAAPAVLQDGTVLGGSDDGVLVGLRPSGAVRFRIRLPKVSPEGATAKPGLTFASEKSAKRALALAPEIDVAPLVLGTNEFVYVAGASLLRATADGAVRSRFVGDGKIFTAPAALPDGTVVFGDQRGHVHGVDRDGREVFHVDLGADVDGAPAVFENGDFIVGVDGSGAKGEGAIVKLGPRGEIRWRTPLPGHVRGALSIGRDGDVRGAHFGGASSGPSMVRLAGSTGALVSKLPFAGTGSREFGLVGGPTEDGHGTELFGTPFDELVVVPATGELQRISVDGDVDAPPLVLPNGTVIVATRAGGVYLLGPDREVAR